MTLLSKTNWKLELFMHIGSSNKDHVQIDWKSDEQNLHNIH